MPVGRLALDGNAAVLEYDRSFAGSGLTLSPLLTPSATGLVRAREPRVFTGLHGVFADSLPDAWGQLLVDRRLRADGIALEDVTVLDRLAIAGARGRGALVYSPAVERRTAGGALDLDRLAAEVDEILAGADSDVLRELEALGGSSGGARPKIQVALDDRGHAFSVPERAPAGYSSWIVKVRARTDPFVDAGPLEATYAEMARRAGIDMPRTRLIASSTGAGYFATERFDRGAAGARAHMLSIAGMLEIDWAIPSLDYDGLMQAVRAATRSEEAVLEIFRRMVFNVLARNRDDHAKQHSLLMRADGTWRLSPAYDLTFSSGPGNEHYLAVNGRGRGVARDDLLAIAKRQSVSPRKAGVIIDAVGDALAEFPRLASDFGVSRATRSEVQRSIAAVAVA